MIVKQLDKRPYLRGFDYQDAASSEGWARMIAEFNIGAGIKTAGSQPGNWTTGPVGFSIILSKK